MTGQQDRPGVALEQYHAYLECLAWMRIDPRLRGKFGLSDIIQNTLLEAYQQLQQLQALDPAAQKAWLRKAAARNLLDEIDRWRTGGRDVARERANSRMVSRSREVMGIVRVPVGEVR